MVAVDANRERLGIDFDVVGAVVVAHHRVLLGRTRPVDGDDGIPSGTLAVPDELADETLPSRKNVLLADADRAADLLKWEGWEPPTGV